MRRIRFYSKVTTKGLVMNAFKIAKVVEKSVPFSGIAASIAFAHGDKSISSAFSH